MSSLRETAAKVLRFAAGGVISSGVTIGITALLHEQFELDESIAAAGGLATALVINFLVLRHLVFGSRSAPVAGQFTRFLASSGIFRGIEYIGFLIVNKVLGIQYLLGLVIVLGLSFILKFIVYERFVFSRPPAVTEKTQ